MAFITGEEVTDVALKRWATARSPRMAEVLTVLVGHIHEFAREVHLTEDEWMRGLEWLESAATFHQGQRRELLMFSEVLGLSTLVLELEGRYAAQTPATPLGPYIVHDAPEVPYGQDISGGLPGTPLFITGMLTDDAGKPVPDALVTAWQADTEGHYHQTCLRGKFRTRADGTYCIRSITPVGYSMPMDGPVGDLLRRTEISSFRPAHIHFLVEEPGFEKLNTELFPSGGDYVDSDAGFATKEALVRPFVPCPAGTTPAGGGLSVPYLHVEYNIVLQRHREQ